MHQTHFLPCLSIGYEIRFRVSLLVVRAFPYWAEGSWHTAERSRRRAAAVSLFGCKETSFHRGQTAEGRTTACYSWSSFCAGISRALSCSYGSYPLHLASSMSSTSQALHETDSTRWPGRKLMWQKSELYAPGLMNWISSVKALMNISLVKGKGMLAWLGWREERAGLEHGTCYFWQWWTVRVTQFWHVTSPGGS